MKTKKKIKINWKPPELMTKNKPSTKSQDEINAELNELASRITEWYVEE